MCNRTSLVIGLVFACWTPAIADELPTINDSRANERFEFKLTYDVDFSVPGVLEPEAGMLRQ
ncbi:MAG: hypothetical protein ABJF15_16870, partial [Rhodopirellula bahusiensis]